jgi:ribosomal protein L29
MLLPGDVDVATLSPEELRRLVAELLGEVARLRAENATLREVRRKKL